MHLKRLAREKLLHLRVQSRNDIGVFAFLLGGIRELTRQITLEDILNTYQRHDAENGIFDYCI